MLLLSLLIALPLALAAPSCLLRPSSSVPPSSTPSGTPSTSGGGTSTNGTGTGKISMSWYADWHTNYGVSNIPWANYTHMAFFTAQPSSNGTIEVILTDPSMVDEFVSAAKAHSVVPVITVGGWSGSLYWSSSVATAQNRTTLANSLVQYAQQHGFEGLDFDWEFPNQKGIGCNTLSPQDSANFLSFIQEVRQLASNFTLSAAVHILPWDDANSTPLTDVSEYAKVLDHIEIMNYDVYGSFSTVTGPNSPLNDSCVPTADQQGSAVTAVNAWTKAGFSPKQIVLGVAAYGHSFTVTPSTALTGNTLNIYTAFDKYNIPNGDSWSPPTTAPDECGNPPVGNGNSGLFNFWGMIDNGFLNQDGTVASGMNSLFDECSQTPFVYNPKSSVLVAYDDAQSFAVKGQFIKDQGLGGFAMFETGGDHNGILIGAITSAMA